MDSMPSRDQIHQMAARWLADGSRPDDLRIHTDTSDFFALDAGDIIMLDSRPYLVRNSIREGRFGLEDEIKFWVKRAIDLVNGAMRIIKLVFYERFDATIGGITFECFRSPRKEARILELVKNHPNFMHGLSAADEKGNIVRVLETISGPSLAAHVADIEQNHETYFFFDPSRHSGKLPVLHRGNPVPARPRGKARRYPAGSYSDRQRKRALPLDRLRLQLPPP
jgi:hypothetical protein